MDIGKSLKKVATTGTRLQGDNLMAFEFEAFGSRDLCGFDFKDNFLVIAYRHATPSEDTRPDGARFPQAAFTHSAT